MRNLYLIVVSSAILLYQPCSSTKAAPVETPSQIPEPRRHKGHISAGGSALVFAEELKMTLERYLLGICSPSYKAAPSSGQKNWTQPTCDADLHGRDLAGRLAALALRAGSAGREGACAQLGPALSRALGDLARAAARAPAISTIGTNGQTEKQKQRKMSKSQKNKIAAKQRQALAVRKKAAAAAAAKQASTTSTPAPLSI